MTFVSDIVDGILASAAFIGSPSDPQVSRPARSNQQKCILQNFPEELMTLCILHQILAKFGERKG